MAVITIDYTGSAETPTLLTLLSLNRTDTGASVTLPSPATFTQSGSVFSISFTEPAPGLTYTYTFQRTWSDGTTSTGTGTAFGTGTATPSGYYGTLADWYAFAGQNNVITYSDLDGNGVLNTSAAQDSMNVADAQINNFYAGFYPVPLQFTSGTVDPMVKRWWVIIGIADRYFSRGQFDAKSGRDPVGERFSALLEKVYQEMDEYRGGFRTLPVQRLTGSGTGNAIQAVPPTVNADGSRYIPRPAGWWGPWYRGWW